MGDCFFPGIIMLGESCDKLNDCCLFYFVAILRSNFLKLKSENKVMRYQMKKKKNLRRLLNLGFLDYTNLTSKIGELDMPYVRISVVPQIDYLATFSQPSTYFHSQMTAVSFFEYDLYFDGLYGLYNAILYGVKDLQDYYRERFNGVRYFIAPDYSKCGDVSEIENVHRQFMSRVVSIWLSMELHSIVIPLVSCANKNTIKYMLHGMEDCTVVAFNAKGPMGNPDQLTIFLDAIEYTVDHLDKLKSIIVYSSSPDVEKVRSIFKYAINAGIDVQIPDNMLQSRNRILGGDNNDID